jgi:hypothetical protein
MTIDELKTYVRTMLNAAFPTVTIQFELVGDDPFHLGVAVYGVESIATKWVKDKILDIDEKLCANSAFAITPLVRDEATTEKYYPELVAPWKQIIAASHGIASQVRAVAVDNYDLATVLQAGAVEGEWEYPKSVCASAENQELALAA